jgi:hypothetical protein
VVSLGLSSKAFCVNTGDHMIQHQRQQHSTDYQPEAELLGSSYLCFPSL